jgi:MarR family transcriptional regulator, organic hydroperoxide resistance regulator
MVLSDIVVTSDAPGSIIVALQQATHVTLHTLGVRLAQLNLAPSEQNVLAVLADGGRPTVGDLASATGTRPTTLTSVLDRLERRSLLRRQLDPADRRSFLVTLTPFGRQAARSVLTVMADMEHEALAALTPAQIAGFRAVTRALTGTQ